MNEPLKKSKVFLYWFLGGLWGSHWEFLNAHTKNHKISKNFNLLLSILFGSSLVAIILVLFLLNFYIFEDQYNFVAVLLISLFIINVVFGAFIIPYFTRKFNALYYRRNIDTDLILQNKKLAVEDHIRFHTKNLSDFEGGLKKVEVVVQDINCGRENADTSFFKNLVTFGNYNKLQREKGRLKALVDVCTKLRDMMDKNIAYQSEMNAYLQQYRIASYRNINLAKDLLAIIKSIKGKEQDITKDISIDIPVISVDEFKKIANLENVKFDSSIIVNGLSNSVHSSLENIGRKLDATGDRLKKDDLIVAGTQVAIETFANVVSSVIGFYDNVTNQIVQVQENISKLTYELERQVPELLNYRIKILRQLEILTTLKEMNKAFIKVYEPIRLSVYNNNGGYVNGYKEFLQSQKANEQLSFLMAICASYSQINKQK